MRNRFTFVIPLGYLKLLTALRFKVFGYNFSCYSAVLFL